MILDGTGKFDSKEATQISDPDGQNDPVVD